MTGKFVHRLPAEAQRAKAGRSSIVHRRPAPIVSRRRWTIDDRRWPMRPRRRSTMDDGRWTMRGLVRVRLIQEGGFLRQGGTNVVLTPNVNATAGRIDLALVRTGDALGANGSGLLAAIQFDAVGAGTSQLAVSGTATNPTGAAVPLQFLPGSFVVR